MIPIVITQTGAGTSGVAAFNIHATPFNVGIGCVVSGAVNYTIQHTFDDVMITPQSSCAWFNHDDADLNNATGNQDSNYDFPVRASQVVVNSGTGSVKTTFIQAGGVGG